MVLMHAYFHEVQHFVELLHKTEDRHGKVKYLQKSWRLDFMNHSKQIINCVTDYVNDMALNSASTISLTTVIFFL